MTLYFKNGVLTRANGLVSLPDVQNTAVMSQPPGTVELNLP